MLPANETVYRNNLYVMKQLRGGQRVQEQVVVNSDVAGQRWKSQQTQTFRQQDCITPGSVGRYALVYGAVAQRRARKFVSCDFPLFEKLPIEFDDVFVHYAIGLSMGHPRQPNETRYA